MTLGRHTPLCAASSTGTSFLESPPRYLSAEIWWICIALDGLTKKRKFHCASTTYSESFLIPNWLHPAQRCCCSKKGFSNWTTRSRALYHSLQTALFFAPERRR